MTGTFVVCLVLFALAPFFLASPQKVLPKCTIVKGKKKLNINVADLPQWEKDGWKRADDPVPSESSDDGEDGEYTLEEAIQKCRSNAALEEIVEANGIDVDLAEFDSFADKKDAVLEALEEADE